MATRRKKSDVDAAAFAQLDKALAAIITQRANEPTRTGGT